MSIHQGDAVATQFDEAQARFDAWRQKNDPDHKLTIEEACARYNRDQRRR